MDLPKNFVNQNTKNERPNKNFKAKIKAAV